MIESKHLKENQENIEKLMKIPYLDKFDMKSLGLILKNSRIRMYEYGETVIKEGEKDAWLYFLLSGELDVMRQGSGISRMSREGEVFGEMSIIDGSERSTTVMAHGNAVCLAVDTTSSRAAEDFTGREDRKELTVLMNRLFVKILAERLRDRTVELSDAKMRIKELEGEIEKLQNR